MERALALLVNANSYTENPEGGRKVGALLRELYAIPGVDVVMRTSERFADHVVFRARPRLANKGAVALVGHLDTVFPPGVFEGYRSDASFAYGPGVLDMKGGLVVIAYALRALASTGDLETVVPLRGVIVSDEEVGSPEGQGVIAAAISGSDACLVFEAGRAADAIITRRKGTGAVTIVARGRAAHAGNAHRDGANAIWALSRFIDRAQRITDYDRGITVNVGRVVGGHSKNTVPDHAEAQVDLRFCSVSDGNDLVAALRRAADEAAAAVAGTRLEIHGGVSRLPLERSEASQRLLVEYGACARAHGLGDAEAPLIGGGSDASTASALGMASIDGLGPRGRGFHTTDECIELSTLVPKAQALARFLAERKY
jgi:glutamate carboxypeptidase